MTTQDIIDHLKAGRPLTKNVAKEIVTELERVKALEEALRPMAKMWSATRAAFEKEGVALPPGILIEPSLTSKFSDISAEQLDAMVKALEETCQK